ncbi:MAG: dihydroorotate dehydrogenase-like protein [Acidobacteriales bacterium]|nr:dihydroorotate dehydrogenase-like protein [Terriglobales bacterium]
MPNLSTSYLGLKLKNPLVVSAGPLCKDIGNVLRMEDAGASAVVLHSLFEEQITLESQDLDRNLSAGAESFAESLSYFPDMETFQIGPEGYIEHIRKAKEAVDIPVIGSLNGVSTGGWIRYAKLIEEAGADALELNIYFLAVNPETVGSHIEDLYVELVSHIKASVRIPVAVKLGPYFSSFANIAGRLDKAGADALVIFNRFYQPDYDLEALEVVPNLTLSRSSELLLRLYAAATLYGHVKADLAITGGVHTVEDVLKSMMAGGKVAMMTSALLQNGIGHIKTLNEGLAKWMEEHEYESIKQMQGSMSMKSVAQPTAYLRANYMKVLGSYVVGANS